MAAVPIRWGVLAILLFCLAPHTSVAKDGTTTAPLVLDWAEPPELDDDPSLICAEAAGYLTHSRQDVQHGFKRLHACISEHIQQQNTGICAPALQNLQQSLTLLDDANAQFVSVCP